MNEEIDIFCIKCNEDLLPSHSTKKDKETGFDSHLTPFSQNLVNFLNQITENNEVYEINVGISPPVDCSDYQNIATLGGHKDELEITLYFGT